MVRTYKKKSTRLSWSLENMKRAIDAVLSETAGYRKAARLYSVPQTTLERHVGKIRNGELSLDSTPGNFEPAFSKQEEEEPARKRQKLDSNEENVVRYRPVEHIEIVPLQENQFHSQQLHISKLDEVCIPEMPVITATRTIKRSPSDHYEETPGSPQYEPLSEPCKTEHGDSQSDLVSGQARYDEFDHFGLMIASKVRRIEDFEERETLMNVIQNIVYQSLMKRRPAELPP